MKKLEFNPRSMVAPVEQTEVRETYVPVTWYHRPPKDMFLRVSADPTWSFDVTLFLSTNVIDAGETLLADRGATNILLPALVPDTIQIYGDESVRKARIVLCYAARLKYYFWWLMKYNVSIVNSWNCSAFDCAKKLETVWGFVKSDQVKGEYRVIERCEAAKEEYPWEEPVFPESSKYFDTYFAEAFNMIVVTSAEHACFKNKGGFYAIG